MREYSVYFPFFILHDWGKRSAEARSPHLSGVALFFHGLKKSIDKRKETLYHVWQLAGANQILSLWLAASNRSRNLNRVIDYEFDKSGRRKAVHHCAD